MQTALLLDSYRYHSRPVPQPLPWAESTWGEEREKIRILLVEDCASDVYMIEKMLLDAAEDGEFDITAVPRLADTFKLLDSQEFDIILLDLNLLDIDGVASVAAIHAESPNIPLIVYSGMEDRRLREEALMCGARSYVVKGRETGQSLRSLIHKTLAQAEI